MAVVPQCLRAVQRKVFVRSIGTSGGKDTVIMIDPYSLEIRGLRNG